MVTMPSVMVRVQCVTVADSEAAGGSAGPASALAGAGPPCQCQCHVDLGSQRVAASS